MSKGRPYNLLPHTMPDVYARKRHSFVPYLLPEAAIKMDAAELVALLGRRYGRANVGIALDPAAVFPSPLAKNEDAAWLKRVNMAGVNVRTVGTFWNVVKYALTLPDAQSAVHLLPIWEPGVVGSLYGMTSWRLNPEFFSAELAGLFSGLNTVEKQLKVVINLLHLMGKSVGMDVIPHTDRYSEIVLANPGYFEWLQRKETDIIDHSSDLYLAVQSAMMEWLDQKGPAIPALPFPAEPEVFFSALFPEDRRNLVLFGLHENYTGRNQRREQLLDFLFHKGYEPIPATMAPPYRGLEVDPRPQASVVDLAGRVWRDYRITQPQPMSRVFGPLTRYRFYESLENNRHWALDFRRPVKAVWDYFCGHYARIQAEYGFDFMRGDMSHVQMRPEGVPVEINTYYDPHKAVRNHIREKTPHFGYFAETFMAAPGVMAYGNEYDHLEASDADSTLGDLQSMVVGSTRFMAAFSQYAALAATRRFAVNFTVMTADKDDPRFDKFYLRGNEVRLFIGLFLTDWPSYMGLGFETRDAHPQPAENEYYSKLYVFQISEGPKSTKGPYRWGCNKRLFRRISEIRIQAEQILKEIGKATTRWIIPPDPTGGYKTIAWTQTGRSRYLFAANLDLTGKVENLLIPAFDESVRPVFLFSTHGQTSKGEKPLDFSGYHWQLPVLKAGEGICFRLE